MQKPRGHLPLFLFALLLTASCKDSTEFAKPTPTVAKKDTGPHRGGYVVIPSNEPPLLNPVMQAAFERVTPLVFEGLVGLDSRLDVQPLLASRWDVSDDGKVITFYLRKNAKWHDGKPFTSADVAFTLDQIQNAQVPSVWRGYLGLIEKVEVPDKFTVKVTYSSTFGPALATWTFGIIPKHVYQGQAIDKVAANHAPIGTGPFRFVRWLPKKSIVLEANETYWNGRPHLDKVEVVFDTPDGAGMTALQEGKLDLSEIDRPDQWSGEALTPQFRERYETATIDESAFTTVAWNCQRAPFTDKRVRQAMTHALDRARIIEDVLKGSGRRISSPFYSTMWGADPNIAPRPFDLQKAALLMDAAGKRKIAGKSRFSFELISLTSHDGPVFNAMMNIYRRDLKSIGVDLKVTFLEPSDFVGRMILHEFDAAYFKWWPDIADPDPFVLLHTSQIGEGANYAGYSSSEADDLMETGRARTDLRKRKLTYHKLHAVLYEDQPYTFVYSPMTHYAWGRRAHGVNPIDIGSLARSPGILGWWVDR